MSPPEISRPRERARLFAGVADLYDRARPRYPAGALDAVLGPDPAAVRALDVACGTGILARDLADRGASVLGVELSEEMARVARRAGLAVEVGEFEVWDPSGRVFDVVACAQAWHWLDAERARATAHRALADGGRLCLLWNVGVTREPAATALADAYLDVLGERARTMNAGYATRIDGTSPIDADAEAAELTLGGRFTDPEARRFAWSRAYSRDEWVDELATHSDHLALDDRTRARLVAAVTSAIDAIGGELWLDYECVVASARRA